MKRKIILVSKESVVLCWWKSERLKFGFTKQVDESQITAVKDFKKLMF